MYNESQKSGICKNKTTPSELTHLDMESGTPGHGKIFLSSAPPIELHVSGPNELIGLTH